MTSVVYSGWLDKEIAHGYIIFNKYSPRFVVLTQTSIRYYHREATSVSDEQYHTLDNVVKVSKSPANEFKEIPLALVNEQALIAGAQLEVDVLHIENTSTGKMYRFRAQTHQDAFQWRMMIVETKGKNNISLKVHFQTAEAQKGEIGLSDEEKILSIASSWHCKDNIISHFENSTFSNIDKAKYVADAFFDALWKMSSKDRSNRAKEMGKALIAWLDEDHIKTVDERMNSKKSEIFTVWLRVALSREFLNSCKFDDTPCPVDDGDVSSESSSMTHSTVKSRMRNAKKGSMIMPFRADTGECLFISAIFHSSCAKSNTLYFILHPVLRCISGNADNYVYPKSISPVLPVNLVTELTVEESAASKGYARNSLSRRSRNLFNMVRNTIRLPNRNARSNSQDSSGDSPGSRPQSWDGRVLTAAFNNFYSNSVDAKREHDAQRLALAELELLTPIELKRLEVRKRLLEVASSLTDKFQDCVGSPFLPLPVSLIIRAIRDLIITDKQTSTRSSLDNKDRDTANLITEGSVEDECDATRNKRRFEYGTYFTSCSALLFLRLICRAIISPDDYGVTEKLQHTIYEKSVASDSFHWPNPAFAAMTVLAHTLFQDDSDRRSGTVPVQDKDDCFCSNSSRKMHMSSSEILELQGIVLEVKNQIPLSDVSLYLELYTVKKSTTGNRSSLNLRNLLIGKLDSDRDTSPYQFDWTKPSTRWALAEVAKTVQHIANISCLPKEEMQAFARDSLLRQNIAAGFQDKDSYDTHVFTGLETETIACQISIASKIKEVYERLGDLPPGKW